VEKPLLGRNYTALPTLSHLTALNNCNISPPWRDADTFLPRSEEVPAKLTRFSQLAGIRHFERCIRLATIISATIAGMSHFAPRLSCIRQWRFRTVAPPQPDFKAVGGHPSSEPLHLWVVIGRVQTSG